MKANKGSIQTNISVTIICFVLIAGAAYFFTHKKTSQIVPQIENATTTVPVNTYGMSEYVDLTYGFSFWYPSVLPVTATTTNDPAEFPGGAEVETLQIGSIGGTEIYVVNSLNKTITDEPNNHASPIPQTEYFYASGTWMVAHPDSLIGEGVAIATTTADISKTTVSGLIMLPSGRRFDSTIIPLSMTRFLVISDGGGSSFTSELAGTVAQINSSIDSSKLESALQAESNAYAVENGCKTDSDCQNGDSCMTEGPLITNQPVRKICVSSGQAVPL